MLNMLKVRLVKMIAGLVAVGLCLVMLTLASAPAQAAEEVTPTTPDLVCNDTSSEEALAACVMRLRQPMADTASPFGGKLYLGQTFVAPAGRKVCKVDIWMAKNVAVAFGDPVLLQVETLGGALLDSTFVPSGVLPLGVPVWQTFDFGCDGGNLVQGQTYRLTLFSRPNTPTNAFRWLRNSASVIPGLAMQKFDIGPWANIAPVGSDFAFRMYMCN